MDTLFIIKDAIATNVLKVVDTCQPCVQEAEMNWADVEIIKYICIAVVLSVLVIAFTLGAITWHNYRKAKECDDLKNEKEEQSKQIEKLNKEIQSLEDEVKKLRKLVQGKSTQE